MVATANDASESRTIISPIKLEWLDAVVWLKIIINKPMVAKQPPSTTFLCTWSLKIKAENKYTKKGKDKEIIDACSGVVKDRPIVNKLNGIMDANKE